MYCYKCGEQFDDNLKFCPMCGTARAFAEAVSSQVPGPDMASGGPMETQHTGPLTSESYDIPTGTQPVPPVTEAFASMPAGVEAQPSRRTGSLDVGMKKLRSFDRIITGIVIGLFLLFIVCGGVLLHSSRANSKAEESALSKVFQNSVLEKNFETAAKDINIDPDSIKNLKELDAWKNGKRYQFTYAIEEGTSAGETFQIYANKDSTINCIVLYGVKVYRNGYEAYDVENCALKTTAISKLEKKVTAYLLQVKPLQKDSSASENPYYDFADTAKCSHEGDYWYVSGTLKEVNAAASTTAAGSAAASEETDDSAAAEEKTTEAEYPVRAIYKKENGKLQLVYLKYNGKIYVYQKSLIAPVARKTVESDQTAE